MLERLNKIYGKDKATTPTPAQIERTIKPKLEDFPIIVNEYPPSVQDIAKKTEKIRRKRQNRKPR